MGWAAARLNESEQDVCRLLPQPIAATWRDVLLARNALQTIAQLDACLHATCATLGCLALVEYLRGGARQDAESVLERLEQPTPADWRIILQNVLAVLRARPEPALVLAPLLQWQVERVAGGASGWRRLDGAVTTWQQVHSRTLDDDERTAAAFLDAVVGLLQSLRWLGAWRLFRVQQLTTLRRRGFSGAWQVFAGGADWPEPSPVQWTAHLEDNAVYLLSPDAHQILEVSPFFRILPHSKTRKPVLYHYVAAPGLARMEVRHQPERTAVQTRMEGPGGEMTLMAYLASRQLHDPVLVNDDLSGRWQLDIEAPVYRPPSQSLQPPMAIPDLSPAPAALPRHLAAPQQGGTRERRMMLAGQLTIVALLVGGGGWWLAPRLQRPPLATELVAGAAEPARMAEMTAAPAPVPVRAPAPAPVRAPAPAPVRPPAPAPVRAPAPAPAPVRAPVPAPRAAAVQLSANTPDFVPAALASLLVLRPSYAELVLLDGLAAGAAGAQQAWTARFPGREPPVVTEPGLTARLVREATAIIYGPRHKPAEKRSMAKHLYGLAAQHGAGQGALGLAKIYWYGERNAQLCAQYAERAVALGAGAEAKRLLEACRR